MSEDEREEKVEVEEMIEALYDVRDEIVEVAKFGQRMAHTGLKRRAIIVLLKDATGVPMNKIEAVLKGIENLGDTFLNFPDAMTGRESLKRRAARERKSKK